MDISHGWEEDTVRTPACIRDGDAMAAWLGKGLGWVTLKKQVQGHGREESRECSRYAMRVLVLHPITSPFTVSLTHSLSIHLPSILHHQATK